MITIDLDSAEDLDMCELTARTLVRAHLESPIRVSEERVRAALDLLDVLPEICPAPDIRVGLDGELAFLWEQGAKTLVVLPEVNGWVKFGVEFGRERRDHREPFIYPKLPLVLSEILDTFVRCDA